VVKATPAQIRKSITRDALISFEDGKPYKTLKRHLTTFGLTIEQYRAKWGLPADYPTVAPSYSEARSAMAKALGLGQGGRKPKERGKKA
jgi:predicted transcriptional regulator